MWVCTCMRVRGQSSVPSSFDLHLYFLRLVLSLDLEFTILAQLADGRASGLLLPLPPKCGVKDGVTTALLFMWVLGVKLRSSCLCLEHFFPLDISPA